MENTVITAIRKKALKGGKVFRAMSMKFPNAYTKEDEDTIRRQLHFVSGKGDTKYFPCTSEVFLLASNKLHEKDTSPGLHNRTDCAFQAYVMKQEDGTELAVALDVLPRIDAGFKNSAENSGDSGRRAYLFEVEQTTGGFTMLKAARDGSDAQVRQLLDKIRPLESLTAGLKFNGGFISSVSGLQFEVVPA